MLASKLFRYLVVVGLTLVFLYNVIRSLDKFTSKRIGETHSTEKAEKMFFPSLHVCPEFNKTYSRRRTSGTRNLTEYYENRPRIDDLILKVAQTYETENG